MATPDIPRFGWNVRWRYTGIAKDPFRQDHEIRQGRKGRGLGVDDHQAVGFGHLRGDLREMLGAGHANRDWKTNFDSHRRRTAAAISDGAPKRWVQPATSAKASSMEI